MFVELRERLRSGAIRRHQLGAKEKRLATIACLLESVLIYDFSARVCNFITANRYLRIGETLIPRRRFPFRNPAFVLFCTCVNSRCNRIFLFPLVFTLCYSCLPVARCRVCASLPYASPGSYSVVPRSESFRPERLHGALSATSPDPAVGKAARWIFCRAAVLGLHYCPRPFHPSSPRIRFQIDRSRDKASIAALS